MARTVNPQHTQALMDLLTQAPYFSLLGMRFEAMEPGYCRLTLPLSYARHGNAFGSIHGGAYSSLIDTAAYWAAYCDMDEDQGTPPWTCPSPTWAWPGRERWWQKGGSSGPAGPSVWRRPQ